MSRGWRVCRHSTTNCSTITRKSSSESQQRNPNIDTRTETNYFKLDVVAQCVLLKLPRRKCRMMLSDRLSTSELQLVSRSNQKSLPSECEKSFRLSAAKEAILSKYCWVNVLLVWRNDLLNYTRVLAIWLQLLQQLFCGETIYLIILALAIWLQLLQQLFCTNDICRLL